MDSGLALRAPRNDAGEGQAIACAIWLLGQ